MGRARGARTDAAGRGEDRIASPLERHVGPHRGQHSRTARKGTDQVDDREARCRDPAPILAPPSSVAGVVLSPRGLDLVGLGLALSAAGWIGLAGAARGGQPLPAIAIVVASVLTVIAARRVATRRPWLVMVAIGTAPVLVSLVVGRTLLLPDALGYTNASGALYLVSSGGLLIASSLAHRLGVRRLLQLGALAWLAMPWVVGARTATLFAALLVLALVLVRRDGAGRVLLVTGAAATLMLVCLTTAAGAMAYTPVGRPGLLHRAIEASIGELRLLLWGEASALLRENPFFGVGPGRFAEVSALAAERADASWVHNEYLQMAAETGVPGGLLLVVLALWAFAYLWPAAGDVRTLPAVVVLAGIAVNASIDFIWHFPTVPLLLAALVGGAAGLADTHFDGPAVATTRALRVRAMATLLLWVLLLAPAAPLNPAGTATNQAAWIEDPPGVAFTGIGGIRSPEAPEDLYRQLIDRGELTVELLLATHSIDQTGSVRIISASQGNSYRNVTIAQDGHRLVFRLRTTRTNPNGTDAQVDVEGVFGSTRPQHVVVTTDRARVKVYVDGVSVWEGRGPGGSLDSWDPTFLLLLGNESTGERGWRGEVHLAAIYDRVLDADEVANRHAEAIGPTASQGDEHGDAPLVLHTFDAPVGRVAQDRGTSEPGVDLVMPPRFPAPPDGVINTLVDVDRWAGSRFAGHVLLFALWTAAMLGGRRPVSIRDAAISIAAGSGIVVAATIVRFADGRRPTIVDLVGAALGCALAATAILLRRRSSAAHTTS